MIALPGRAVVPGVDAKLPSLSVEQIVTRNLQARGGAAAWKSLNTISWKGEMGAGASSYEAVTAKGTLERRNRPEKQLPFSFEFSKKASVKQEKGVVCISGKLSSYKTKAEAAEVLAGLGYSVKDSLTKEVTILLNESGIQSAKTAKADTMGVRVVNNIQELMENN
jgi:hypothetical protein